MLLSCTSRNVIASHTHKTVITTFPSYVPISVSTDVAFSIHNHFKTSKVFAPFLTWWLTYAFMMIVFALFIHQITNLYCLSFSSFTNTSQAFKPIYFPYLINLLKSLRSFIFNFLPSQFFPNPFIKFFSVYSQRSIICIQ